MQNHSQIVIGPDGTVLAVSGQLPPGLIDTRLEECVTLAPAIRTAGATLLHELRASGNRVASQTIDLAGPGGSIRDGGAGQAGGSVGDGDSGHADGSVQIVAIEALAIRRTATDLRTLLTSKLAIIASQAESAGVTLSVDVADDVPAAVHLDSEKMAWVITTLVGNALRYVQAASRRLSGRAIDVRATFDRTSSDLTIAVHDNGPGIPADTVRRLFIREGLNVRGSGLALLLVRDILAAHGGTVDLRSNTDPIGHGTTIRLTLPTR